MKLRTHALRMAAYNHWMNTKLLNAAALLSDEQRKKNVQAFFSSLHGTFNHLIASDRIWLSRFTHSHHGVQALNEELYTDFQTLRAARNELDAKISGFAQSIPDEPPQELTYQKMSGMKETLVLDYETCVVHWFNHQTHHRGQATTIMMQLGLDPGVTDLISMPSR